MSNSNLHKLTRAELADIYEKLVLYYEQHQGLTSELLSTQVKGYRKLKSGLSLQIQPFSTEKELATSTLPTADNKQNLIWFHNAKSNILKSIFTICEMQLLMPILNELQEIQSGITLNIVIKAS